MEFPTTKVGRVLLFFCFAGSLAAAGPSHPTSGIERARLLSHDSGSDASQKSHSVRSKALHGIRGLAAGPVGISLSEIIKEPRVETGEGKGVLEEPGPIPLDLPIPPEFLPAPSSRDTQVQTQDVGIPSPQPAANFQALFDNKTVDPPDTNGAVGPTHLLVALNTQVRVQTKSGDPLVTVKLSSFWGQVAGDSQVYDPRVAYDPYEHRWIMAACSRQSPNSGVLIGVSQTEDPAAGWSLYRVAADDGGRIWTDSTTLGFNRTWIVVQVNMYQSSATQSTTQFDASHIYVFDKASLYGGLEGRFTLIRDTTIGATQAPAKTYDATAQELYLLQTWKGNASGSGVLRLYSITGEVGSEVLTPVAFVIGGPPFEPYGQPNGFAPQAFWIEKLDTGDSRMHSVVYRNGTIWGAHTVYLPDVWPPTRFSVQWWQITPDGAVVQRGLLDDASGRYFRAYPSIAVNSRGDALIGYARFAATEWPGAAYSIRAFGDPAGAMRGEVLLKGGEVPYKKGFRWGDYSTTSIDPTNDIDFWTIQEYAGGFYPPTGWGTWWGRIVPDSPPGPPPTASFSFSPTTPQVGQQVAFADTSAGSPNAWLWAFGDGATASLQNVTHVYKAAGSYNVTLTASNSNGSQQSTKGVTVSSFQNCSPSALCLLSGRFRVSATWRTRDGASGGATAVQLFDDSGYFWFFGPTAIEVVVKAVNGCALNDRYWMFAGGLTDVAVTLTVTDTVTGTTKTYTNPQGSAFQPIQDTTAFSACGS